MDSIDPSIRHTSTIQILFVDFDGVLHPELCHESKHFMHRDTFEDVVRAFPDIGLVISSTWRLKRPLHMLKDLFSEDVAARVIGTTPLYAELEDVPDTLEGYQREVECRSWLRQNGCAAQEWLALDDRSWNFRPFSRDVFLVDGNVGLDTNAAKNLVARIHGTQA
jgi:hypothetical protein